MWKKNEFKFQCGFFAAYDPINNTNILIGADDGPSWLMPSINFKVRFLKGNATTGVGISG